MKPANEPSVDYKGLVQQGYDLCASAYQQARQIEVHPELEMLTSRLEGGSAVLDIGCGAGVPIARTIAQDFRVTGVDISSEMLQRARVNVPEGCFIHSDIMSVELPLSEFDAVVAFYSIFHLPREEHRELFRRIHGWLKPGGYLLASVARRNEAAYTEDDFFGVAMYWSNYSLGEYKALLTDIGFSLLEVPALGHGYAEAPDIPDEHHPMIFAQKA